MGSGGDDSIAPATVQVPRDVLAEVCATIARLHEIGALTSGRSAAEVAELDEEAAELREALDDTFETLLENAGLAEPLVISGCVQIAERRPRLLTCAQTCTIL